MSVRLVKTVAAAAAFAVAVVVGGDTFSADKKKGGTAKGKGASGDLETVAPVDAVIGVIKDLTAKAKTNLEDDELADAGVKFAVIAELANLQTLREDADIKAWAAQVVKVYAKAAVKEPNKGDVEEVIKESKKLIADGEKNAKKWASAKPGSGSYKTQQDSLELLMGYVGAAHGGVRKTLGQPGMNFQKAWVGPAWAMAEIGNVTALFSKEKDWKGWSAVHRDSYADIAKKLTKGEVNEARKSFETAQANCKACHDKYQNSAPVGLRDPKDAAFAAAGR